MKSIDPSTNRLIIEYPAHSSEEVCERIRLASEAFHFWSKCSFTERAKCLSSLANILRNKVEACSKIMTMEMGKPIKEARAEILKCATLCDFFAKKGEEFLRSEVVETEAYKSFISFEPLGLILGIMPWNFPFWQVMRFAVTTVMAGNGILLKHAPNVCGCALSLEALFEEAGFPKHLFKVLLIETEQVKDVIADDRVKGVALTGSEKAGMVVASEAGKHVKKCVLELGGSDPFIVLEDASFETCISTALSARLKNCGQSCIASKRFIIIQSLYDRFCEELIKKIRKIKIGDPLNEDTEMGPLAREDLLNNIEKQVTLSLYLGAKLLYGGKRLDREGFFYPPTVIANIKKDMPVYSEETFGPVFALKSVQDHDEAIAIANDTHFGLWASLWTNNLILAEQMVKRIEAGNVFVNSQTVSHPKLPFGGIKKSGYGRELSHYGIKEFVNIKTVYINK
jgi:succinate-semialdehyde dehydrogenase / glutarate-semialdehyde dehydrogenase